MADLDPKVIESLEKLGVVADAARAGLEAGSKASSKSLKTALEQLDAYQKLTEQLKKLTKLEGESLKQLVDKTLADEEATKVIEERSKKEAAAGQKIYESGKKLLTTFGDIISSSLSASQSIYNSSKSFTAVVPTLNLVGNALNGIIDAIGKSLSGITVLGSGTGKASEAIAQFASVGAKIAFQQAQNQIENAQKFVDTYQQLSKVGLSYGGAVESMRQSAVNGGMALDSYAKFVTSNIENLSVLGGSIEKAADRVTQLGVNITKTDRKLLGMYGSYDALQGATADYMAMMARYGIDINRTDKDLTVGAKEYLYNMKELSALTGKSAEQLKKAEEERQKSAAYNLAVSRMGVDQQANVQRGMELTQSKFGDVAAKYAQEFIATGGNVTSETALLFKSMYPEIAKTVEMTMDATKQSSADFRTNSADIISSRKELTRAEAEAKEGLFKLQAGAGAGNPYLEMANSVGAAVLKSYTSQGELVEAQAKLEKQREADITKATDRFVTTIEKLEEYKRNMDIKVEAQLEATGKVVADLYKLQEELDKFVDKLPTAVNFFIEQLGRAAKELNRFSGGGGDTKSGFNANDVRRAAEEKAKASDKNWLQQKWAGAKAKFDAMYGSGEEAAAAMGQAPPRQSVGTVLGDRAGSGNIDPRLQVLMDKIGESYPGSRITGLNDAYHSGDDTSKHSKGLAMDFVVPKPPTSAEEAVAMRDRIKDLGFTKVLDEYFTQKSPKWTGPHFHAELAKGGITQGPSLAGEAGPEAVIPLPDGRNIPVKMDVGELINKLDEMIDVLRDGNNNTEKIFHASM